MSKHHKNKSQQQRHGGTPALDTIDREAEQSERMVTDARVTDVRSEDNRREGGRGETDRKAKGRNERRR